MLGAWFGKATGTVLSSSWGDPGFRMRSSDLGVGGWIGSRKRVSHVYCRVTVSN